MKHTVNNSILLIAQHEPTFELDTSHRLANLILSKTLICKFNYPPFSDEKTGLKKINFLDIQLDD